MDKMPIYYMVQLVDLNIVSKVSIIQLENSAAWAYSKFVAAMMSLITKYTFIYGQLPQWAYKPRIHFCNFDIFMEKSTQTNKPTLVELGLVYSYTHSQYIELPRYV